MSQQPRTTAERPPAPRRRWRRIRTGLAVLAVIAVAGLGTYLALRPAVPPVPVIDLTDADPAVAEAITAARTAAVQSPRSAGAWGRLAMTLHAHAYRTDATTCYAAAATLDTNDAVWPYLQGILLVDGPEPSAALSCLEHAARLTPANSLARLRRAELLLELGRTDEAGADFEAALVAAPDEARAAFGLARVAAARGQDDDVLRKVKAVADHPCARKRAAALAAAAHERLHDRDAADRERRRLGDLPEDMAWPDVALEQVASLQVGLRAALSKAPRLVQQGRLTDATDVLDAAVRNYPQSDEAWASLGKTLAAQRRLDEAEMALKQSLKLAPHRSSHWALLGALQQVRHRYAEAVEAYRQALAHNPTDAVAHYTLGQCLEEQGDRASAAEAYAQALRYRPDMVEARQRLAKLKGKS
jgi:tetratricopeptide (TPR) repeat protein